MDKSRENRAIVPLPIFFNSSQSRSFANKNFTDTDIYIYTHYIIPRIDFKPCDRGV